MRAIALNTNIFDYDMELIFQNAFGLIGVGDNINSGENCSFKMLFNGCSIEVSNSNLTSFCFFLCLNCGTFTIKTNQITMCK